MTLDPLDWKQHLVSMIPSGKVDPSVKMNPSVRLDPLVKMGPSIRVDRGHWALRKGCALG